MPLYNTLTAHWYKQARISKRAVQLQSGAHRRFRVGNGAGESKVTRGRFSREAKLDLYDVTWPNLWSGLKP